MFYLQPLLLLKWLNCPGQLFRLHNAGEAREAREKNDVFSPASPASPVPHRSLCRLIWLSAFTLLLHSSLCFANFVDVASQVGLSQQPSEFRDTSALGNGVAFSDYDNDGDLDLFVVNLSEGNALYRNENSGNGNHWLKVKLIGTISNRNAIGAVISLVANGKRQLRYISGGESYFSFNELAAHFGLAQNQRVELIEVRWPSGRKSILKDVTANQAILVTEGAEGYIQLPTKAGVVSVEPKKKQLVTLGKLKRSALLQNYPNPFNPETWIPYILESDSEVTVEIFNVEGELVRNLELGKKEKGAYLKKSEAAYWDGKNDQGEAVGSGVYFYSIYAGDFVETRKMILAR